MKIKSYQSKLKLKMKNFKDYSLMSSLTSSLETMQWEIKMYKKETKTQKKNLAVAFYDYKKANSKMHHD